MIPDPSNCEPDAVAVNMLTQYFNEFILSTESLSPAEIQSEAQRVGKRLYIINRSRGSTASNEMSDMVTKVVDQLEERKVEDKARYDALNFLLDFINGSAYDSEPDVRKRIRSHL
ncbi:Pyruvate carboxylase 1 [Carpediemonas membranifera]|uniref:Pyruvate carboxylase 1 n=1 Tax=Carpediemonas membranifera TaxID=201153 RepID=A0A8J6B193_9EUKA|nr:Pyruvate carboxylase 1 [Carpediemonas membranifera]|eukprot:KAG9390872.1 Pyruvate carboxylase 1 [Carpediemonas membranifera]